MGDGVPSMRLVRKLGHLLTHPPAAPRRGLPQATEQVRLCLTTASTVRWSVHAKRTTDRVAQPSKCEAIELKHLEHARAYHLEDGWTLHRQMLPHHFGAQLIALARRHDRAFGHYHILFGQPCRKVETLFDQQNGEPARPLEAGDDVFDAIGRAATIVGG